MPDVYVAMDDIEKALDVLAEGYEQTQSEWIATRQEELHLPVELIEQSGGNLWK